VPRIANQLFPGKTEEEHMKLLGQIFERRPERAVYNFEPDEPNFRNYDEQRLKQQTHSVAVLAARGYFGDDNGGGTVEAATQAIKDGVSPFLNVKRISVHFERITDARPQEREWTLFRTEGGTSMEEAFIDTNEPTNRKDYLFWSFLSDFKGNVVKDSEETKWRGLNLGLGLKVETKPFARMSRQSMTEWSEACAALSERTDWTDVLMRLDLMDGGDELAHRVHHASSKTMVRTTAKADRQFPWVVFVTFELGASPETDVHVTQGAVLYAETVWATFNEQSYNSSLDLATLLRGTTTLMARCQGGGGPVRMILEVARDEYRITSIEVKTLDSTQLCVKSTLGTDDIVIDDLFYGLSRTERDACMVTAGSGQYLEGSGSAVVNVLVGIGHRLGFTSIQLQDESTFDDPATAPYLSRRIRMTNYLRLTRGYGFYEGLGFVERPDDVLGGGFKGLADVVWQGRQNLLLRYHHFVFTTHISKIITGTIPFAALPESTAVRSLAEDLRRILAPGNLEISMRTLVLDEHERTNKLRPQYVPGEETGVFWAKWKAAVQAAPEGSSARVVAAGTIVEALHRICAANSSDEEDTLAKKIPYDVERQKHWVCRRQTGSPETDAAPTLQAVLIPAFQLLAEPGAV